MGCANAKESGGDGGGAGGGSAKAAPATAKFVETIFTSTGAMRELKSGEELIKRDTESESAFYIKEGKVKLVLVDGSGNQTQIATRGTGDVLGELSLLLGHDASVSAIADGACKIIEVKSNALLSMLRDDPGQSGRLFKVRPTHL